MSTPPGDGSGWTLDTLYAHLTRLLDERDLRYQQRFEAQTKAVDAALLAAKEAVTKAEVAADKRFESVNEFRSTLSDQASQFMTRAEADAVMARHAEKIQELTDRINRSEGKGAGSSAAVGYLFAAVAAVATIITVLLAFN